MAASSGAYAGPNRIDGELFYSTNYGAAHIVNVNFFFTFTRRVLFRSLIA